MASRSRSGLVMGPLDDAKVRERSLQRLEQWDRGEPMGAKGKDNLVRFGTKWLDLDAQALRDDEGNEHPLTASEFGLRKVFAAGAHLGMRVV